jgi:serine/threonine protein kinase/tetratricopeptide (TPR) repeat protein
MGIVYKADDLKLGRTVALKFLSDRFSQDRDLLDRFRREAQAASLLNHPNICTIHDIDEADGWHFIVLELLEGSTLRDLIARERLPIGQMIELAAQVADGLEAAHRRGIVHRDIKPANIFVTANVRAKILDFGLAKLRSVFEPVVEATISLANDVLTVPGIVVGTIAYMSPEQARGAELDTRTDLFSFGAVLYEMATGQQAFTGSNVAAVLDSILYRTPPAPIRLNPECPVEMDRIIRKALEKDPNARYQSAKDLLGHLCRLRYMGESVTPAMPGKPSIVVLPFENLSPDPENAFFADGLTEEVIADLSKVRSLRVISRTSALLLKGSKKDVPTIGRDLNVRFVLEGSVRRAGDSLRVTAQLIEAITDTHLWAEKYTGKLGDVFDLQEQLSRRIVDALKISLTVDEDRRLRQRPIPNVRVLDCYMRARQEIATFSEDALQRACGLTNQALAIAGENALLYATLALIHWQYHNAGYRPDEETLREAAHWAAKALAIDPDLSQAHTAQGFIAWTRGTLDEAVAALKRAAELDTNSDAFSWLSMIRAETGGISEARRYGDQAVGIDPLNTWAIMARGWADLIDGRFDDALARFRTGYDVPPGDPMLALFEGVTAAYAGYVEQARSVFERLARTNAGLYCRIPECFLAALRSDRETVLEFSATDALGKWARRDKELSWFLADCLSCTGATDPAFGWLRNSIELGFFNHRFWSEIDPFMVPLRRDPKFAALMERAREKQRELVE